MSNEVMFIMTPNRVYFNSWGVFHKVELNSNLDFKEPFVALK